MIEFAAIDRAKYAAAKRASLMVEPQMHVGLGTGSTAAWLVRCLGARVQEGLRFYGVASSARTEALARAVGIELVSLDEARWLDLTIDGADEVDRDLNLIKGGGGALLQEKILATASDRMVVITDVSKHVDRLGGFPLPVEVVPFGWQTTRLLLEEVLAGFDVGGRQAGLRLSGDQPFTTDEGNYIIDLHLHSIPDPRQLSLVLNQIPGVVENGLFIDICDIVITGDASGAVRVQDINNGTFELDQLDLDVPQSGIETCLE